MAMAMMKLVVVDGLIRSSASQLFKPNNRISFQYRQRSSPENLKQTLKNLQENFSFHGETPIRGIFDQYKRVLAFEEKRRRSLYLASSSVVEPEPYHDFLRANKLGRSFLRGGYADILKFVPVESLRGKIVFVYFACSNEFTVPCMYREFYNTLKRTKPDSFEMIYVAPLPQGTAWSTIHDQTSAQNAIISTLPWPAVPLDDLEWISYLRNFYSVNPEFTQLAVIDPRDSENKASLCYSAPNYLLDYGPYFYPFTDELKQQLEAEVVRLGKETSIEAILGSDSRDYLMDSHSNKVPISSLQDKDVLVYAYGEDALEYDEELPLVKRLEEIYNQFRNHGFEIVSINFDFNGGNVKLEKLWKIHLAQIPWLSLPLGDAKIWLLRKILMKDSFSNPGDPILYVKPKGESLLDPCGYQVFKKFGIQAFPFSIKAAAHSVVRRLKGISFKSFVDKAGHLGLDFNSLIRNKANGGTEHVSLSTILEKRARGILLLFTSLETCSQERLKSLINVYLSQNESSSSSFEVIFVSRDKDTQSFHDHFSVMPWFAFQRPLKRRECKKLVKTTARVDFIGYSHFFAFGPDHLLLQAGLLTKSFENCEFPFINDAESADHLAFCITTFCSEWWKEGYQGDGWWEGIEWSYVQDPDDEWSYGNDESDGFEDEDKFNAETC